MSEPDDPVISYDPFTRIVTIDGYRFSRELFSHLTASPAGISFRVILRNNGVITLTQERDPLEAAAPDMLAALGPLATTARSRANFLRHQALNSTSGLARVLIEEAEGLERMCVTADAAIAKAAPNA